MDEITERLGFARAVAREAGALALQMQPELVRSYKADRTVVTQADLAVQHLIRERLLERYPQDRFLGEETLETRERPGGATAVPHDGPPAGPSGQSPRKERERTARQEADPAQPGPLWVVDPIDGTDSYSRRMPVWGVCIGLAVDGCPELGVVYLPVSNDLFQARRGGPALQNEIRLQVNSDSKLVRTSLLLATSTVHRHARINFPGMVRAFGSAAAHICFVASGSADAALMAGMNVWDVLAPSVILEAAGGGLFQVDGSRFAMKDLLAGSRTPILVASHRDLVQPVLATLEPR